MASVVRFEQVSKKFVMRRQQSRSLQELALGLFRRREPRQEFWALRDVSFTVEPGQTVGLIGSNGAGKSTALKLVAGIIEPTSGAVSVRGRVGALLELGAGFHPDLTGRDNIYLNASVLGLSRSDVRRRMDEIIAFAELERFIDVPVKHYSSGMYVRLGFAVAVHTDPEVLLIDEVLAVGDQAFQDKCLKRINRLHDQGVPILFVSHGLDMVRRLCDEAVWIDQGRVRAAGKAGDVVTEYLNCVWTDANIRLLAEDANNPHSRRWGSGEAEITGVAFLDAGGHERRVFQTGESLTARIHYQTHEPIRLPAFGVAIYSANDAHVNGPNTVQSGFEIDAIDGKGFVDYVISNLPLLTGRYEFTAAIYDYHSVHPYDHHHRSYTFEVQAGSSWEREGLMHIPARWEHCRG